MTTWEKSVDSCDTCLDAGPADSHCQAAAPTQPPTTTTTQSTTKTTRSSSLGLGTTSSTTTPPTTLPQAGPSAYEERPPPRGDFQNEEHVTLIMVGAVLQSTRTMRWYTCTTTKLADCSLTRLPERRTVD